MRKILAILLTFVMLAGITACGGNGGTQSSAPASSIAESSEPASEAPDSSVSEPDSSADEPDSSADEPDSSADEPDSSADEPDSSVDESDGSSDEPSESGVASTTVTTVKQGDKTTATNKKTTTSRTVKVTTAKTAKTTAKTTKTTAKTTATTTNNRKNLINVVGSPADPTGWIYMEEGSNGVMIREATFDSGKGGEPAEIVQISDIHFNKINDRDRQENNASVMSTYNERKTMLPNGASRVQMEKCMAYAADYDQTVITGDTLDYLSWGAIEMLHDVIWKVDPNAWVSLGNHDAVRTWSFNGSVGDVTTLESRYDILQDNWKHDIFYTSKVIKNKAMIIQMDNGNCVFWEEQISKLEADLAKARKNGYVVLLFYHIPLSTGEKVDEKGKHPDAHLKAIRVGAAEYGNFYITAMSRTDSATKKMYELITNNADVIKGTFCGHLHSDFYTEIKAKTADGKDALIPQYVLTAAYTDNGHVMKITVN